MPDRPTLYLTNWSSRKLHGPSGRLFTIMSRPRAWEWGRGRVIQLVPELFCIDSYRAGKMPLEEYRRRFEAAIALETHLAPGELHAYNGQSGPAYRIQDGDTLCCACSRTDAAAGLCHRVWAAPFLARAGWRVVLDGAEVQP